MLVDPFATARMIPRHYFVPQKACAVLKGFSLVFRNVSFVAAAAAWLTSYAPSSVIRVVPLVCCTGLRPSTYCHGAFDSAPEYSVLERTWYLICNNCIMPCIHSAPRLCYTYTSWGRSQIVIQLSAHGTPVTSDLLPCAPPSTCHSRPLSLSHFLALYVISFSCSLQDIVRRYGPSLKDPAKAEPVAYDSHFDRLLREAEKETAAEGRRASASPKVGSVQPCLLR